MTGPTIKAKRKRYPSDDRDGDRRLKPTHMFHDIGPPIVEADYRPLINGNPEESLAAAFILMRRDYGGPLPPDFALRSVLKSADVLHSVAVQKAAQMKKTAEPPRPLIVAAN